MQMVEFEVKDGKLHITLLPEAREDVEELRDKPTDAAFAELIEYQQGNGWTLLAPEDIGALTSAPIVSEDVDYSEDGEITRVGRVYYFADYAIKSEVEELLEKGVVVFQGCD